MTATAVEPLAQKKKKAEHQDTGFSRGYGAAQLQQVTAWLSEITQQHASGAVPTLP